MLCSRFVAIILGLLILSCQIRAAEVRVILWFDTEDYLLPADDDASKRLAELLAKKGIRATFKVVGEKARVLEKRGRKDVIRALQKHDIGYHANFHSVHPTPSEYLAECGFLDGVDEFIVREGPGAADVRRVFGVPTLACYGQPGSSWGAQTLAGLKQIGVAPHGVPCYVDEGDHIGYRGVPFWFENALVVYNMADNWTRMDLHQDEAFDPACKKVAAIADRLRSKDSPGLISIFYHPCEWVHQEFWDGVNFRRGANPPRSQWKPPGQLPPEKTEAAFARFSKYIDFIKGLPSISFVTASDLPKLYPDAVRQDGATKAELLELAASLSKNGNIDAQKVGHKSFSPADQFELLLGAAGYWFEHKSLPATQRAEGLFGPELAKGSESPSLDADAPAFEKAVSDALVHTKKLHRVPARVFIGPDSVSPEAFLIALSRGILEMDKGSLPILRLANEGQLMTAEHVAANTPKLFGGWIIHREGFRAPKILEVARLQSWTLKPAVAK